MSAHAYTEMDGYPDLDTDMGAVSALLDILVNTFPKFHANGDLERDNR